MSSKAAELLGANGPFAKQLPSYEARAGQLEMASAVEQALAQEHVLLCEAGTGTGKTLAYSLPALLSGKTVVISTATKALQEQIYTKDLPLLAEVLGQNPQAALMKGLSNYVCRRRYEEFRRSAESLRPAHARPLELLKRWIDDTETGDLGELAALGEDDPTLREVHSSSDTRVGQNCRHFEQCAVTNMRREAEQARLIVVNHHLFFADLALRGEHPGRVIPPYDAVVFDEAHQLEDIATDFFGVRISSLRIARVLAETERAFRAAGLLDALLSSGNAGALLEKVKLAGEDFFSELLTATGAKEGRTGVEQTIWSGTLAERWHRLDAALEALAEAAEGMRARIASGDLPVSSAAASAEAFEITARRAEQFREQLAAIVEGAPNRVTWVDVAQRRITLSSSPVDVSQLLAHRLFEVVPSVVLTSATLAAGGSGSPFRFLKRRLGLNRESVDVHELVVGSPFDYASRALLYAPRDLPDPRGPDFVAAATERTRELIELTDGGAFVLTTSHRSLRAFAEALRGSVGGRRLLVQGDAPKTTLLGTFRAAGNAVLVATSSFWEGVDVPGRALRLVVLEKIPFAVPTDPIVQSRAQSIEAAGGNPFLELHVPGAAIALKQGFGRLIRTAQDAGVVALLDERVHSRGYGALLVSGLPPAQRTTRFEEVEAFWARWA